MTVVVCAGLVTLDVHQVVDRVPGPDEKVVARSAAATFGGPAANAAATAALLGAQATLATACGRGPVGRLVADDLGATGVRLLDVAAEEVDGPAVSTVLVTRSTGARAVASTNAAGVRLDPALTGGAAAAVEGAGCLLLDGHHLDLAVVMARAARRLGVPVLLDGGSWKPGLERLLPSVDVAVLSADFALPGGGDPAARLAGAGCPVVAVSRGGAPVTVRRDGRPPVTVPVPRVDVVDTLGAGDVLHGTVAVALARGRDPLDALRAGVEVASLSCAHPGARGWASDPATRARARAAAG